MKKALVLCLVPLVLFVFSGCLRVDATVKINANGTVDSQTMVAMSDSLAAMGVDSFSLSQDDIDGWEKKGYSYQHYVDANSGYTGFTLSRSGADIKELTNTSTSAGMESLFLSNYFEIDGKHISIDFVPLTEEFFSDPNYQLSMIKSFGGYMKYTLELPAKPSKHNATSVSEDGKTLTWDLTTFGPNEKISAEFDLPSRYVFIWITCGAAMLIIAATIAYIVLNRKRKARIVPSCEAETTEE